MTINSTKLTTELLAANIQISGASAAGVVWDTDNNEIQDRPDVAAVIAAHDPILHIISPDLAFLKGDDIHSVTLRIATDPDLETVNLDVNGETLPVDLIDGAGSVVFTSDTPGDVIVVAGSAGALPGALARIYVV